MNIEQFYKLIKDILQIEREGKSFPTHLETLIGAYLEAYRDIDDSCFKGGAEGKSALMAKIEDVFWRFCVTSVLEIELNEGLMLLKRSENLMAK